MALCIIALPIFALLGIFSVKYRKLTLESLDCLFRTATLRKCRSGLDERIRSNITGKLINKNQTLAKFFYRNYKAISFLILILFLWSGYYVGEGIYNYVRYGNCNGPESNDFCIFDPLSNNGSEEESERVENIEIKGGRENAIQEEV